MKECETKMKNGKKPSRTQKILMRSHGLNPNNWLVVKNLTDYIEVVNKTQLEKNFAVPPTRKVYKDNS